MKTTRRAAVVFLDEKTKRLYMDDEMKTTEKEKRERGLSRAGRRVFIYLYM